MDDPSSLIYVIGCSGCEYHWISISNLHSGVQQWNQLRQVFRIGPSEGSQKGDLCGAFWSMCSWHVAVTLFSRWTWADGAWARSRGLWPAEWWLGYLLRQVGLSLKTRTITWYMMMQWFNDDHENSGVCMTMFCNFANRHAQILCNIVQYLIVDALLEADEMRRSLIDLSEADQALCAQTFLRARFMRSNWSGALCPEDPEGAWPMLGLWGLPVKTERSQAAGPFQSSWSITSQRMAATLKSSSRNLNASWTWDDIWWRNRHFYPFFRRSLDSDARDCMIHRYTQIYTDYAVLHSAIQCCLHLLPTFPISKGANFWLWAAEGDHCGS